MSETAKQQEPDFYTGIAISVDETLLGLSVLSAKVRSLKHSHSTRNCAATKMDAEAVAKIARQIAALNDHLASVCVGRMARRARV